MRLYDATRTIAVVAGLLAAVMFYQPWVGGKVPGVGAVTLSADDLANGRARTIADAASAPPPRAGSSGAPGAPTTRPEVSGGLALPTRVPTFAPGAVAPTTMPSAAERTAAANVTTPTPPPVGGLSLPTRVPTFAPGSIAPTTMPSAAERTALATPAAGGNAAPAETATRTPAAPPPPATLPKLTLFIVPLAGLGLAVFTAIHARLRDPRDITFSKWWTVLLGTVGTYATWNVIATITGTTVPNNLLDPGEATETLWGAWCSLAAFAVGTISSATAWLSRRRTSTS
ncbi:MAG: hypothetical protein EXR45_04365 [Chloroflexi bacterium]|nr:hypothetical protein [Chloroflexota bacterium]